MALATYENHDDINARLDQRVKKYGESQLAMTQCILALVEDEREMGEEFFQYLEAFAFRVGASVKTIDDYISCLRSAKYSTDGAWYVEGLTLGHHQKVWYRCFPSPIRRMMLERAKDEGWEQGILEAHVERERLQLEGQAPVPDEKKGTGGSVAPSKSERAKMRIRELAGLVIEAISTIEHLAPDDEATDLLERMRAAIKDEDG